MANKLKNHLLLRFKTRFGHVELVRPLALALATILNPRFKKLHFMNPLAIADTINAICKQVIEVCHNVQNTSNTDTEPFKNDQVSKYDDDLWTMHDTLATVATQNISEEKEMGGISIELRQFLNLPVANRQNNLYETWDLLKLQFPNVHKVALRYLSIVATSVPAERLFSEADLIATDMRNRLKQGLTYQCLFFFHQ